jgi:hypothetical protein
MKRNVFLSVMAVCIIALISSCSNYGTKKTYDGTEIYYTDNVSEADADLIGNYLIEIEFTDGSTKSVQLDKPEDALQVRFVTKEGIEDDPIYIFLFEEIKNEISESLYDGKSIEVHLCDNKFNTLKVL